MKIEYEREYQVNYTEVDQNLKLALVDSITLQQNMGTEYFVSKTKVHF